jgi:glucose-1-phosphate adenylyltransferase
LSLNRHIRMGWNVVSEELGEFIEILPPQKRVGEHWYLEPPDAVYQNLYSITRESSSHIIVLLGDHVYKMDYAKMLRFHIEKKRGRDDRHHRGADHGFLAVRHRQHRSSQIVYRIRREATVPDAGARFAGHRARVDGDLHLSRGRAGARARRRRLARRQPARLRQEHHPSLIQCSPVYSYRFYDENKKAAKYWRDIGTLDAYFEASMDLCQVNP